MGRDPAVARRARRLHHIGRSLDDHLATDGDEPVTTPYDDTVLVMPSHVNVKVGGTAVRLGQMQVLGSTEGAELG